MDALAWLSAFGLDGLMDCGILMAGCAGIVILGTLLTFAIWLLLDTRGDGVDC